MRELVRAGRADDDGGRVILFVPRAVIFDGVHRAGGVRIHRVLILFKKLVDGLDRFVFAAEVAAEQLLHLRALGVGEGVDALLCERLHQRAHARGVAAGDLEEQALEVARNEDIHRGGHRLIELAALVVHAGADEVGEDVVFVGGADELADGQPHAHRIVGGENVAEIAGGDGEVDLFSELDLVGREQVEVGGEVVGDLRGEAAEVDGVCRREDDPLLQQLCLALLAREDALDGGLALVEVAAHGEHVDVAPLLRRHLQLLHLADAVARVKDHDLDAVGVLKALERGLARVAAGRDEDEHLFADAAQVAPLAQQIGQEGERHVFEGARRAVEQLEHIQPGVHAHEGRGIPFFKLSVRLFAGSLQFVEVVIVQKFMQYRGRALGVAHRHHRLQLLRSDLRKALRHEQAAVFGDALRDRPRARHTFSPARTDEFHAVLLILV